MKTKRANLLVVTFVVLVSLLYAASDSLEKGRNALREKSYAIAARYFDEALQENLPSSEYREALFCRGLADLKLGNSASARGIFEKLVKDSVEDQWQARALWQLALLEVEDGLAPEEASTVTSYLTRAETVLTREAPDELFNFYTDIINRVVPQWYLSDEKNKALVLDWFNKAISKTKKPGDLAELHLRRASFLYERSYPSDTSSHLSALRTIVSEFPDTDAARQAQMKIAEIIQSQNDLKAALEEWKKIATKWSHTPEGQRATEAIKEITHEFVAIDVAPSFLPHEPVVVRVGGRNVSNVRLSFFRLAPEDMLSRLTDSGEPDYESLSRAGELVLEKSVVLGSKTDYRGTTTSLVIDPETHKLKAGIYLVLAQSLSRQARCYRCFTLSNLVLLGTTSGSQLHFWTVNATDGKSRSAVTILVRFPHVPRQKKSIFNLGPKPATANDVVKLSTDETGFAQLELPGDYSTFDAVAFDKDDCALLARQWKPYWSGSQENRALAYMYTDRPVYRPSDTLNWKGIVRKRVSGTYDFAERSQLEFVITSPRGEQVASGIVSPNEFGNVHGTFQLPQDAQLGVWNIALRRPQSSEYIGSSLFRVEEYKKPEFEVMVSPESTVVKSGKEVQVQLEARYLFGQPVARANVHYVVTARPRWWFPLPWAKDRFAPWFVDTDERVGMIPFRSHAIPVAEGDLVTDNFGKASFRFVARCERDSHISSYEFAVSATVRDPNMQSAEGSAVVYSGDKFLNLGIQSEHHLYSPGDLAKVHFTSKNIAGTGLRVQGKFAVEKLRWDENSKTDIPTTLSIEKIETNELGEARVEWRIPKDITGRLRLLFIADDPFGGIASASGIVHVADKDSRDLEVHYQGVQLIFDKDTYEVGDTARVLILSEYPRSDGWFSIDTGSGLIEQRLLNLTYRTNFLEIPVSLSWSPNIRARVALVHHKKVFIHTADISVPPVRQTLQVSAKFDKQSYRPRDEAVLKIEARRWDGKPVEAEFSLSVFDKALESIAKGYRSDIRSFFYGSRRPIPDNFLVSLHEPLKFMFLNPPADTHDYETLNQLVERPESPDEMGGRVEGKLQASYALRDMDGRSKRAMMPTAPAAEPLGLNKAAQEISSSEESVPQEAIRSDFRDSVIWSPVIQTNAEGKATIKFPFPDSLTTWRTEIVGIDREHRVGEYTTSVLVQKNFIARLALPRFLCERDTAIISAMVHNYLPTTQTIWATLSAHGVNTETTFSAEKQKGIASPGGHSRFAWKISADKPGDAVFRLAARAEAESDGLETSIPVIVHGIDKKVFRIGSTADESTGTRKIEKRDHVTIISDSLEIPAERIKESTRFTLSLTPSVATQIRDALPFLVNYPYGCVEQTMSRFLPAVIVARTLQQLNIPRDELLESKLPSVLKAGIKRLQDMQNSDGSWGWMPRGPVDEYMTAYVMYGLTLARQADCAIPDDMFTKGLSSIERSVDAFVTSEKATFDQQIEPRLNRLAFQCLVLSLNKRPTDKALNLLYDRRDALSPAGLAMLGQALRAAGRTAEIRVVRDNLMNFAVPESSNGTVHWEGRGSRWGEWYWWNDKVEATSLAMNFFIEAEPDAPVVDQAARWLVLNRRGMQWKSTKDTAWAVMALSNYLRQKQSKVSEAKVMVNLPGMPTRTFKIDTENFFSFAQTLTLEGAKVPDGFLRFTITVEGDTPLYYTALAEYFNKEEPIPASGNEIIIQRVYERRTPSGNTTQPLEDWKPLRDGDMVSPSDIVRVTLHIRSLNDYEYLVFEDRKPAGLDATEVESGWKSYDRGPLAKERELSAYREFHDQYVAFFVPTLPRGEWTLTYELRPVVAGLFHILPTRGYAMYYPDIYANSDELRLGVVDDQTSSAQDE